jgi:protein-export membrane protein SecD
MDSAARTYGCPAATILVGAYIVLLAFPADWIPWAPNFLRPPLHLGLDLQGGTQLDFRISEAEMQKQIESLATQIAELEALNGAQAEIDDKKAQIQNIHFLSRNIVEALRTVLERRVNSMGVSEAVITPSYYGEEKHLLVECPGIIDVQQCIATVGKTILLEFKEQFEGEDEEHIEEMRKLANQAYARITESGETLATVGQDLGPTLGVFSSETTTFRDTLPDKLSILWNRTAEDPVLFSEVSLDPIIREDGSELQNRGIMLAEVAGEKAEIERLFSNPESAMEHIAESNDRFRLFRYNGKNPEALSDEHQSALLNTQNKFAKTAHSILYVIESIQPKEEMKASHILIAYEGAVRADESIARTKEQAITLAQDVKKQLDNGANFKELALRLSDGPSGAEGGTLGTFSRGTMTPAFEAAAFALDRGEVSDIVETEFGYHIIRSDSPPTVTPGSLTYLELGASGEEAAALVAETYDALLNQQVKRMEEELPLRTLFFSFIPTGWKDTALDGKHFRRATVTTDPITGIPVVQIVFDPEGGEIFRELTKRNVGKPIAIFVGGELISAPTVQDEIPGGIAIITGSRSFEEANRLAQDLNTGAIPAPVHLVGQVTVEATLGEVALKQSLQAALFGFLLVGLYMIFYYRVLGVIAAIALIAYALIFTALLKLPLLLFTGQYVVLTLAGIAGIILSVGMAVDANVLIFERMKEELRKGKLIETAADTGFRRAWSAIWASNVSTLLTAAILFIIGTSIVRGFAVTLSMGILISMFTAIVVTRFLIRQLYKSPISKNMEAFGVRR